MKGEGRVDGVEGYAARRGDSVEGPASTPTPSRGRRCVERASQRRRKTNLVQPSSRGVELVDLKEDDSPSADMDLLT